MSHTPGPWDISNLDPLLVGPTRVIVADGQEVPQLRAVARVTFRGVEEAAANARLIAAAPDLLAVLKAWLLLGIAHEKSAEHRLRELAEAVIAKAEGRPAGKNASYSAKGPDLK